jgi:hypothetical protein
VVFFFIFPSRAERPVLSLAIHADEGDAGESSLPGKDIERILGLVEKLS